MTNEQKEIFLPVEKLDDFWNCGKMNGHENDESCIDDPFYEIINTQTYGIAQKTNKINFLMDKAVHNSSNIAFNYYRILNNNINLCNNYTTRVYLESKITDIMYKSLSVVIPHLKSMIEDNYIPYDKNKLSVVCTEIVNLAIKVVKEALSLSDYSDIEQMLQVYFLQIPISTDAKGQEDLYNTVSTLVLPFTQTITDSLMSVIYTQLQGFVYSILIDDLCKATPEYNKRTIMNNILLPLNPDLLQIHDFIGPEIFFMINTILLSRTPQPNSNEVQTIYNDIRSKIS